MGLTLNGGTLYFGDVNDPDVAVSVKEATMDECLEGDEPVVTPIDVDRSFAVTMDTKLDRNTYLSLIFKRKITNNWLKMHGGIMARKSSRRKHSL